MLADHICLAIPCQIQIRKCLQMGQFYGTADMCSGDISGYHRSQVLPSRGASNEGQNDSPETALELSQGEIGYAHYFDSNYSFMVLHAHITKRKERGLLTDSNKDIQNPLEIFGRSESSTLLSDIAVIHCP